MHNTPPVYSSPPAHTSPENTTPRGNAVTSKVPDSRDQPSKDQSVESPAPLAKAFLDSPATNNGAKIDLGNIISTIVRDLETAEFLQAIKVDFTTPGADESEGNGTVEDQPPEDIESPP